MKSSQQYNYFLLNVLQNWSYSQSDSFTISSSVFKNSIQLHEFSDSLLSLYLAEYQYNGNEYHKDCYGLIFNYSVDQHREVVTFKCDSNVGIFKLDLITKRLYFKRILFHMNNKTNHIRVC